jgi:pimeloyl-ACP methyl ester carboxylesterase
MPVSQISIKSCPSLQYYDSDETDKVPLVILGANPSDVRDYDAIKPDLEKKFRVIAINWPGFGGSTLEGVDFSGGAIFFHQVTLEVLEALRVPPALFIGVAVGAYCAARVAIEHPDKVLKLVMVSPTGFTPGGLLARHYAPLMSGRFAPTPLTSAKSYMGHKEKPLIQAMLERAATQHSTSGAVAVIRAVWKSLALSECDLSERVSEINAPTMLIFGKNDPIISPAKDGKVARKAFGDDAEFVVLEARHFPFAEVPEEFLKVVIPFLGDDEDLL